MRAVIQRVARASVKVKDKEVGVIGLGYMILLGVEHEDTEQDIQWLVKKIIGLRVFSEFAGLFSI